ncbi:MAG: hypothetical protein QGH42_03395 [Kiritimatiellia bacterium]|jgi:hypothetical protein|nr:hypothetical protein [Kiritimatiellia bacterium]MDP6810732.1 hypothetical protein [Kiritimatiellia bacterium]MDP7023281.1 hypothetical protein [Kiritimatiellia bacterium]
MDIYPLIVERLKWDETVLDRAIEVLDKWDEREVGPARRRNEWRKLLLAAKAGEEGYNALLELLSDSGDEARRLKDFAPFAGILPREDRRKAFLQCTYDH